MSISVEEINYKQHPLWKTYGSSKDGNIIHLIKGTSIKTYRDGNNNLKCCVRIYGKTSNITKKVEDFIYECFYGLISEQSEVDTS